MGCQASKMLIVITNSVFQGWRAPVFHWEGQMDFAVKENELGSPYRAFSPFKYLWSTSAPAAANSQGDTSVCPSPYSTRDERMRLTHISRLFSPWIMTLMTDACTKWIPISLVFGFFQAILSWYWPLQEVQPKLPFAISALRPREFERKNKSVTRIM